MKADKSKSHLRRTYPLICHAYIVNNADYAMFTFMIEETKGIMINKAV